MSRPFTLAQARENEAFLVVLAQTGNVRLSAREIRRAYSTMQHRRSANAAFAQEWDAALAAAHARFHLGGGKRGPEGEVRNGTKKKKVDPRFRGDDGRGLRTAGGEPVVVRTRAGKLQLRLAHRGKLTRAAEQAFLYALAASANVRLSAAAAGASARAFYRRRRQNGAFAREMRLALETGYERLEMAALKAALPESHKDDAWRQCAPAPIPPMSADQALQLLYLHEKSVRQSWEEPHRRRRGGEPWETYTERLRAMWTAEEDREAEEAALRRAAQFEESGDWRYAEEAAPPPLPPLEQVTGWSKADPKKGRHREGLALFGGWRIEEMERSRRSGTSTGTRERARRSGTSAGARDAGRRSGTSGGG
jgi:hypothetical protein